MNLKTNTLLYYNSNSESLCEKYNSVDFTYIQNLLSNHLKGARRVLEIGSGSGRDANYMLQKRFDIIGIDGSEEMINNAIKKHPELKGRLIKVVLPNEFVELDNKFDGCYSIATLMHFSIDEILKIFEMVYKNLKNEGKFIFSIPTSRDDIASNDFDNKGRRFTIFEIDRWIAIAIEGGFELIDCKTSKDSLQRVEIEWATFIVRKK